MNLFNTHYRGPIHEHGNYMIKKIKGITFMNMASITFNYAQSA